MALAVRTPSVSTTACSRCPTSMYCGWWLPGTPPIPVPAGSACCTRPGTRTGSITWCWSLRPYASSASRPTAAVPLAGGAATVRAVGRRGAGAGSRRARSIRPAGHGRVLRRLQPRSRAAPAARGTGGTGAAGGGRVRHLANVRRRPGAGHPPQPGHAARLADHHHPARMQPDAVRRPGTAGCRIRTGRGYPPGRAGLHGGTAAASGERHAALREALQDLPPESQQLISLLAADPPVPDAEISARLGIPADSIGPTRCRCLDKLRQHPAIAALATAETPTAR
jgi:DNA-directed RNA polymerase specialized sigma24 family protein